jgi:hypothetical protein
MAERTCTEPGCDKKLRARGLCTTHYNQQHQPNRHATKQVACDYCGTMCAKQPTSKFAHRFCSLMCRDLHRIEHAVDGDVMAAARRAPRKGQRKPPTPTRCPVPADHPARWCGTSSPVNFGPCGWCGGATCRGQSGTRAYCSKACSVRAARVRRRGREATDHGYWSWSDFMRIAQRFDFRCAYCGHRGVDQLEPDHVVPVSRQGANTVANLLPACKPCNSDKRDLLLDEWATDRERLGKAPRATSWAPEDRRYWHLTGMVKAPRAA